MVNVLSGVIIVNSLVRYRGMIGLMIIVVKIDGFRFLYRGFVFGIYR